MSFTFSYGCRASSDHLSVNFWVRWQLSDACEKKCARCLVETKLRFATQVQPECNPSVTRVHPKTFRGKEFLAFSYEHCNVTLSGFRGWWFMFSMMSTEIMYLQLYWSSIVKTYNLWWAAALQNIQSKPYLISCKYTKYKCIRKLYAPELCLYLAICVPMCSILSLYSVTTSFLPNHLPNVFLHDVTRLVFHKKSTKSSPARFIWQIFSKSRCSVSYFTWAGAGAPILESFLINVWYFQSCVSSGCEGLGLMCNSLHFHQTLGTCHQSPELR